MESPIRGVGIDFGAGCCRYAAVDTAGAGVATGDYAVPYNPLAPRPPSATQKSVIGAGAYGHESIKRHIGENRPLKLGHERLSMDELAVRLLRETRRRAEAAWGGALSGVAISVPPCFTDRQITATKSCGEAAGFQEVVLVDDARAVALAYYRESGHRETWLVYGLGKSAFFVSLIDARNGIDPLVHNGDVGLGGDEFDAAIVEMLLEQGLLTAPEATLRDPYFVTGLLALAQKCKIQLSVTDHVRISEAIRDSAGRPIDCRFSLSREDFERSIAGYVEKTMQQVQATLAEAGLGSDRIDRVLLSGGSTRIPLIQARLQQMIPVQQTLLPPETVALGAAIYSTRLPACFYVSGSSDPTAPVLAVMPGAEAAISAPPAAPDSSAALDMPENMARSWSEIQGALRVGALENAIEAYTAFLNAAQEDLSYIYNKRAAELSGVGKPDEAVALLEKGHAFFPDNPIICGKLSDLHLNLAVVCYSQADRNPTLKRRYLMECKQHLDASLRFNSANPRALELRQSLDNRNRFGRR